MSSRDLNETLGEERHSPGDSNIKGPGLRIGLNVQRLWECPRCGRRAASKGDVVNMRCGCAPDVWMKLVEPERPQRPCPSPATPSTIFLDEVGDDDLEDLPSESPPAEEIEPEINDLPEDDLDALADEP